MIDKIYNNYFISNNETIFYIYLFIIILIIILTIFLVRKELNNVNK